MAGAIGGMLYSDIAVPFEIVALFLEVAALLFLLHGAGMALIEVYRIELFHDKRFHALENAKRKLIQKMIFALDFFVIADLVRLAFVDVLTDLVQIGVIVAVRTILSWSLSREIHLHKD